MYNQAKLFTLYGLTSVHPGAGTSLSYVDLPVQREKHTSFPVIPGSGIKGVIRNLAERSWNNNQKVNTYFGCEEGGDTASKVSFTDAKILFYPVRSVRGIFGWITCPYVLKRFSKEVNNIGAGSFSIEDDFFNDLSDEKAIVNSNSVLCIDNKSINNQNNQNNQIGLEEFLLQAEKKDLSSMFNKNGLIDSIKDFSSRLAIVSDNVFTDLVNYAIEVRTRIKIDQTTGTVAQGALFTLELIPSESIFYGFYFLKPERKENLDNNGKATNHNQTNNVKIEDLINDKIIQIGGDETIGCGLMKIKVFNEELLS